MLNWQEFLLAVAASLSAFALCWFHRVSGEEWVVAQSIILGAHHGANAFGNWLSRIKP